MSKIETFTLHDAKSIGRLTRNSAGYENSPRSYGLLMLALLDEHEGVITQSMLEDEILKHFGPSMGPDDRRLMDIGQSGATQEKWQNSLAWMKVSYRKQGIVAQRTRTIDGVIDTWIVLMFGPFGNTAYSDEHALMQEWAIGRKVQKLPKKLKITPANKRKHKLVNIKLVTL